jgi:hypothetical protein
MATVKHHNLSAADPVSGAPSLDAADLTEERFIRRPFPKDARERGCYGYLLGRMQSSPDIPLARKDDLKRICREQFRISRDSFDYCWREAVEASGACWDQPGRRRR